MESRHYICIDLKSFYASVECALRGLDPMTARLVVADPLRTEKTICLAVSPALKALGVRNRCRVFEIPKNLDYIMATPRMQKYIDYSAEIYGIYLRYFSPADVFVYSVDECFIDVTEYLRHYKRTPRELAYMMMDCITDELGIRATAGVGTNLYLAKIALDIMAKRAPDFIGELDEESYRKLLWDHEPLTDFWRIGPGIAGRLRRNGLCTMREIAEAPEDWLYRLFGVDAELIIDHAWGREPVTMRDLQHYRPKTSCLSSGQVLPRNYSFAEGKVILREMADGLCLELVKKKLSTASVTLTVGYDYLTEGKPDRGSLSLPEPVSGDRILIPKLLELYERIADPERGIRRMELSFHALKPDTGFHQLSLFELEEERPEAERNWKLQEAVLSIRDRFGKDAILRGTNFEAGATGVERNHQIGGHRSGE